MPSSIEAEQARKVYAARNDLIALQEKDPSLSKILNQVVSSQKQKKLKCVTTQTEWHINEKMEAIGC